MKNILLFWLEDKKDENIRVVQFKSGSIFRNKRREASHLGHMDLTRGIRLLETLNAQSPNIWVLWTKIPQ
jgi:hypothetical protein